MTDAERLELFDLFIDDTLPEALQASVNSYLAVNLEAAAEVHALQETVARLKAMPVERPDTWFTERTLDRLLREHAAAQGTHQETISR